MTTCLGKSCSFCLPRVPFVNCRQFMYLVISLLVLRAGYGIWLYQFLIIAYLFTSHDGAHIFNVTLHLSMRNQARLMTCENIVKNFAEFAYTCFTLINWINFDIHFRYSLIHRSFFLFFFFFFPNDHNSILCLHILIVILLRYIAGLCTCMFFFHVWFTTTKQYWTAKITHHVE